LSNKPRVFEEKPMSTSLVTTAKQFLERKTTDLAKWSRYGVRAEALTMMALQEMMLSPKARDCTPESIYISLLSCAICGLEPGSLKGEAFLVPYGRKLPNGTWITEAKFMAGWKGIRKMALRAGATKSIHTGVVFEQDHFEVEMGDTPHLHHQPRFVTQRGEMIAAYAIARLTNGEKMIEVMGADDIAQVRRFADSKSNSGSSPWREWTDQMARKTVLRRLGKYLDMDEGYHVAQRIEVAQGLQDSGDEDRAPQASELEVIDIYTDGEASATVTSDPRAAAFRDPERPVTEGKAQATSTSKAPDEAITQPRRGRPPGSTNKEKAPAPAAAAAATPPAHSTVATPPPTAPPASEAPAVASAPISTPVHGASTEPAAITDDEPEPDDFADAFENEDPFDAAPAIAQMSPEEELMVSFKTWLASVNDHPSLTAGAPGWKAKAAPLGHVDPDDKFLKEMSAAYNERRRAIPVATDPAKNAFDKAAQSARDLDQARRERK
jgi:recombination protein RecT